MTGPTTPLGHPDNEATKRASVDAVMLAQAFHRGDDQAAEIIIKNCDPYSVSLQLCGFLFATFRHFDVDTEQRLAVWLAETQRQTGETDA
jgi:hypothetical protein